MGKIMSNLKETDLKKIVDPLLDWYEKNKRILPWRDQPTPYRVWVSEIMLQQTRVQAVKPYFARFLEVLPTVKSLAESREETYLKLWEGLGYYNRVRNLHKAAKILVEKYGGNLPRSYQDLLKLPGIGEYTAGAIASIAYGIPVPAVDGNVLRVFARLFAIKEDITERTVKQNVTKKIQAILPKERPGDFNQALMELGAVVCLPNGVPDCGNCPMNKLCCAYNTDLVMSIPIKKKKKERLIEHRTVFIIKCEDKIALTKRPDKGLLSGMWELPNVSGTLSEDEIKTEALQYGNGVQEVKELGQTKHIFTHIEWHMTGFEIRLCSPKRIETFIWSDLNHFKKEFTFPTAFSYYLRKV